MSLGNLECRLRPHPGMALTGASDRLLRPDPEASLPADAVGLPRSPSPRASATRINSLITSPLNWPPRPLGVTSTHRDRDTHRRTHIDRPRHMWKDMPVCTRTHTHRQTHTHSLTPGSRNLEQEDPRRGLPAHALHISPKVWAKEAFGNQLGNLITIHNIVLRENTKHCPINKHLQ